MFSEVAKQDVLLRVDKVSKIYKVWSRPADRFWSLLLEILGNIFKKGKFANWIRKKNNSFYKTIEALKETSLEVTRGTAIGIIGKNGAGKSTLLQIITGSLNATSGTIERRAKIAALLELGSGFSADNTGIENAKINASLLGLTNEEIKVKLPLILEYADIGDFVYQPVRTYSSGMKMRLAFAVAAHVEADIIIIDEALGVGDARFQLKCAKTIQNHLREGRALLFVSHSINTVKQLCDNALLMHDGAIIMRGDPNSVANIYSRIVAGNSLEEVQKHITELSENSSIEANSSVENESSEITIEDDIIDEMDLDLLKRRLAILSDPKNQYKIDVLLNEPKLTKIVKGEEFVYGGELGVIENIRLKDSKGIEKSVFQTGDEFTVSFDVHAYDNITDPVYALTFKSKNGHELYICNSLYKGLDIPPLSKGDKNEVVFRQKMNLMQGEYFLSFGFVTFYGENLIVIQRRYDAVKLQVLPIDRCHGTVNMFSKIEVNTISQ